MMVIDNSIWLIHRWLVNPLISNILVHQASPSSGRGSHELLESVEMPSAFTWCNKDGKCGDPKGATLCESEGNHRKMKAKPRFPCGFAED